MKRFLKITGIAILVLGVAILIAGIVFRSKLEETVHQKLQAVGIEVKNVSISYLNQSIELDSIVYVPADSLSKSSHQLTIQKISVSGVHIYAFLKKKEIIIDQVVAYKGKLQFNKNLKPRKDSADTVSNRDKAIKSIRIKNLLISEIDAAVASDTLIETKAFIIKIALGELQLSVLPDTTYSIGWIEADLQDLSQSKKDALHTFAISKVNYESKREHLEVDSLQILANYSKTDFARIAKIQKTRLNITLPKIICEGFNQNRFITDTTLEIKRIAISDASIHAYRDKHYPFIRDWIMPLPIEGIRRLPFKLNIDSILISRADIAYEEFSEKGLPATGTITFNKLDATLAGLNTQQKMPAKDAFCTLIAKCKVMNSGALHATFKLPLNAAVNYQAYGNVRNMDLKSLNPSLGNLSRIEIADGVLNDLYFNFSYNDNVSTGEVVINYKSLKLQALKKDKKTREINKVLSAAINAVIKSDKDKTVDKSKRTGIIDIERDKKRFVFQLWWKSILDGLQSTFLNNDKKKKTRKESSSK